MPNINLRNLIFSRVGAFDTILNTDKKIKDHLMNISIRMFLVLFILFLSSCGVQEKCEKKFTLIGDVKDSLNNPIQDVDVFLFSDRSSAKTDADGRYSFTMNNLGGLEGSSLVFKKSGFTTLTAPVFTKSEAGEKKCGKAVLRRDVTIVP